MPETDRERQLAELAQAVLRMRETLPAQFELVDLQSRVLWQRYGCLTHNGFTADQAMQIICAGVSPS